MSQIYWRPTLHDCCFMSQICWRPTLQDCYFTDKKEIAEKLNNFFKNVGPKLANELDPVGKPDFKSYININRLKPLFKFTPIEEEETKTIIKNLKPKNSSGHDSLSLFLLKASINSIAKPLTCILNQSLKTGRFPSKLNLQKIFLFSRRAMNTTSISIGPYHCYLQYLKYLKKQYILNCFSISL